jgi:branched-subunit amino acid transport protein AzlD
VKIAAAEALGYTFAMGGIIFFCRLFPFLFFREKADRPGEAEQKRRSRRRAFLNFVEKLVPPAAMTVLAFNALAGSFKTDLREGLPALAASALTALIHLW